MDAFFKMPDASPLDTIRFMPVPVKTAAIAIPLSFGAGFVRGQTPSIASAVTGAALAGAASIAGQMTSSDLDVQAIAAGAIAGAGSYALKRDSAVIDGVVAAASLYLSRIDILTLRQANFI
jgi:hypothetical protein